MDTSRILLTREQFEQLTAELVDELQKIPLYDVDAKRGLASKHLSRVEEIMLENIANVGKLGNDEAQRVIAMAVADALADI